MRWRFLSSFAALGCWAAVLAAAQPTRAACDGPGPQAGTVAGLDARLELTLADGTRLGLAGIDPALPTPDRPDLDVTTRDAVAAWLVGRAVTFRLLSAQPDRWGRRAALVYLAATDAAPPISAAAAILGEGLARYRPDPTASGCLQPLHAIEAAARAAQLGLWADPYYAVLGTTDYAGFAERAGGVVLVEGVLREIRSGPVRTMLLLEPRDAGRRALAITLLQRKVEMFDAAGFNFRALIGRRIRVRGLLETRFGPHIELATPDDVELLPPPSSPTAGSGPPLGAAR
jgi:hypothetical protein